MPYSLRAKGFTVFGLALSVSLVFNQYVNPIALKAIAWKYYVSCFHLAAQSSLTHWNKIVYVVWIAFEFAFLYVYLVEVMLFND